MIRSIFAAAVLFCSSLALADELTVAADGSGKFKTVQDAIDAAPASSKDRIVIHIKPGKYKQQLRVPKTKPMVTFLGDDAATTILTNDLSAKSMVDGKAVGTTGSSSTFIDAA